MSKTYMDLNINERINIKSWRDALSLSYFFKNGNLKEDVEDVFSQGYVGGKTAEQLMAKPQFGTFYNGMNVLPESWLEFWMENASCLKGNRV